MTLGCKVNQYDSQAILEAFQREGFEGVPFRSRADVYLINTCAVTHRSEAKSRQAVRRAIRKNPDAIVAVTGCYAQAKPSEVASIPGVGIVSGTGDRSSLVSLVKRALSGERLPITAPMGSWDWEEMPVTAHQGRTRAYVKVQDGCDQFCSYCIVPTTRGPSRSRPLESVLGEVSRLVQAGYREIVLSGIHLGYYSGGIARLLKSVIEVPGTVRIRLSSIEPLEVTPDLLETMASSEKVCRHLHIPLQSGSDRILRLMNRNYAVHEYLRVVEDARRTMPGLGLTTDVMVGFPGESETDFDRTMEVVSRAAFSRLHVFRYSKRPGTRASAMPHGLDPEVKEERSKRLKHLGEELSLSFHKNLEGKEVEVLVEEECHQGLLQGYSSSYVRVLFPGHEKLMRELVKVPIAKAFPHHVLGNPVEQWKNPRIS